MWSKINYLAQNKNSKVMGGGKPSTEKKSMTQNALTNTD